MAGFSSESGSSRRRTAAGLSFSIYAGMAMLLMYFDQRGQWSQRLHYALLAATYPVQQAIRSPQRLWLSITGSLADRAQLRSENARLTESVRQLQLSQLHMQQLVGENSELRGLRASLPPLISHYLLAEVISVESSAARQRVIVNKGMRDGVHANQAAVDGNGIIGQVASVGPWSSEIILLSDPQLAVPVQIERNQLRTIAVGSGDPDKILLQYLAVNADVKSGDKLLSSGLGGVYPTGFPVGTVIGVVRAENQLLAQVVASPAARITSLHEVALLDFNAANPAAPAAVAAPGIAAGKPAASAPPAKAP